MLIRLSAHRMRMIYLIEWAIVDAFLSGDFAILSTLIEWRREWRNSLIRS